MIKTISAKSLKYEPSVTEMRKVLATTIDENKLQLLFYECLHKTKLNNITTSNYYESLNMILYRLSQLKTDAATKILVSLYSDITVGWDAGPSILASDAVVKCGKLALPYLDSKKAKDARLIKLINDGINIAF